MGYKYYRKRKNCIKTLCQQGIKVVLVTGRMHCAATHIADTLGLDTPIVSYQGGLIKTRSGETLYQQNLSTDYANKIIKWAKITIFILIFILMINSM